MVEHPGLLVVKRLLKKVLAPLVRVQLVAQDVERRARDDRQPGRQLRLQVRVRLLAWSARAWTRRIQQCQARLTPRPAGSAPLLTRRPSASRAVWYYTDRLGGRWCVRWRPRVHMAQV